MNKVRYIYSVLSITIPMILLTGFSKDREDVVVVDKFYWHMPKTVDSSSFIPNAAEGWGAYSSYLQLQMDTVVMELILFRNISGDDNWKTPSLSGEVSSVFTPISERAIEYNEPTRKWLITIKPNGKCYFLLISGPVPNGNPSVVPIQIRYIK